MKEVIDAALSSLGDAPRAALVTPVAMSGSLPTGRDARMLVLRDGSSVGTVGGGRMEAATQEAALATLESGFPQLLGFSLLAQEALDDGLLCGGDATFFVEPIRAGTHAEVLGVMRRLLETGVPAMEVVRLGDAAPGRRMVLGEDGSCAGSLGTPELDAIVAEALEETIAGSQSGTREFQAGEVRAEVFLHALLTRPTLYICGAGHVGLAVARVGATAGFRTVVIDDRPDMANRERFPEADEVQVVGFDAAFERFRIDPSSYIVVLTRGHKWDREVVAQALRTTAGYIGMIGSRRKIAMTWQALEEEGFSKDELQRVHAPIGLDIGADTPGEIAVCIAAELILVRRRGPAGEGRGSAR